MTVDEIDSDEVIEGPESDPSKGFTKMERSYPNLWREVEPRRALPRDRSTGRKAVGELVSVSISGNRHGVHLQGEPSWSVGIRVGEAAPRNREPARNLTARR